MTDIDGTLLVPGQKISQKNIDAVHAMLAAGVKVVIATGRMYCAALPIVAQLGVSIPIISYNGGLIKSSAGKILHAQVMDETLLLKLIDFFEERGWSLQTYSNDALYVAEREEGVRLYEEVIKVSATVVGWNGLREHLENVPKVLSVSLDPALTVEKISAVEKNFGAQVEITRSAPYFAEFMPPGVSKANAIKILAKHYGVDNSEILAIGDSYNDLQMITSVGCGVAMGNAVDAVKDACPRVTDTCENDGFAKAVYDYVL